MMVTGPTAGHPLLEEQMAATLTAEIAAVLAHPGYVADGRVHLYDEKEGEDEGEREEEGWRRGE